MNSISFPQIDSTTVDQFLAAALTEILCQCKQLASVAGHAGDKSSSSSSTEDSGSPTHRDHGEPNTHTHIHHHGTTLGSC